MTKNRQSIDRKKTAKLWKQAKRNSQPARKHTPESIAQIAAKCRSDKEFRNYGKGPNAKPESNGSPWVMAQRFKKDDPAWYSTITAHFETETRVPDVTYAVAFPIALQCYPDRQAWTQTYAYKAVLARAIRQRNEPHCPQEAQAILDKIDEELCWLMPGEYDAAEIMLSVLDPNITNWTMWKEKYRGYVSYLNRIGFKDSIKEFFQLRDKLKWFQDRFTAIVALQHCASVAEAKQLQAYGALQRYNTLVEHLPIDLLAFALKGKAREVAVATHTPDTIWRSVQCSSTKTTWTEQFNGAYQAALKMKLMPAINKHFGSAPKRQSDSCYIWIVDTAPRADGRILIKIGKSVFEQGVRRWTRVANKQGVSVLRGLICELDLNTLYCLYPRFADSNEPAQAFETMLLKRFGMKVDTDTDPLISKIDKGGQEEFRWVTHSELKQLELELEQVAKRLFTHNPELEV